MSSEAWGILAALLWAYAHQVEHAYRDRGGKSRLWWWMIVGIVGVICLFACLFAVLRDIGFRGPFG